jgi:hypothetical protein
MQVKERSAVYVTDPAFAELRLRVERPALGTHSQAVADLHALLTMVITLDAENVRLRGRAEGRDDHAGAAMSSRGSSEKSRTQHSVSRVKSTV